MKYIILVLVFAIAACNSKQGRVDFDEDRAVSSVSGLDKHGAIALFQNQKASQCLASTKDGLIAYQENINRKQEESKNAVNHTHDTAGFVAREFRLATQSMAENFTQAIEAATLSNENIVSHYQQRQIRYPTQVELIHAIARYCQDTNLYDRDISRSKSRADFGKSVMHSVAGILGKAVTAWGLYKIADSIQPNNTVNAPNSAIGDNNGVSEPNIVEPVIVEPGSNEEAVTESVVE